MSICRNHNKEVSCEHVSTWGPEMACGTKALAASSLQWPCLGPVRNVMQGLILLSRGVHTVQGYTMPLLAERTCQSWIKMSNTSGGSERHFGGEPERSNSSDRNGSNVHKYDWNNDQDTEFGEVESCEEHEFTDDHEWEEDDLADSEDIEDYREPKQRDHQEATSVMKVEAPVEEIYELLHSRGFISERQKRPTPNDSVLSQKDHRIVAWYRNISMGLLNYYACCDNLLKVKSIVNYQLRWSAIHTLSKKHKSSSHQIIQKYGKNLVVTHDGKEVASLLKPEEIKQYQKGFLDTDPVPPDMLIDVLFTRMKRRSRDEKKET